MRVRVIYKSKYKGVSKAKDRYLNELWLCRGEINGKSFISKHETERQAAIAYDKIMIMNHKKPVNVLKCMPSRIVES